VAEALLHLALLDRLRQFELAGLLQLQLLVVAIITVRRHIAPALVW
jgi:hypothetical protein